MSGWDALAAELDAWATAGRVATLWWRDDDAEAPTPALERLCAIAEATGAPLALAVIPARVEDALADLLDDGTGSIAVLQHGYAHQNHAGPGDKKAELGPHRPFPITLGEIATGWQRLDRLFGARLRPIMVPPWNRIAPGLVPMLPEIGFAGLSTFAPRRRVAACSGLIQVNTHVDVIDWRGSRGFVGRDAALAAVVAHLAARRGGAVEATEPTGLLTHHLAHDDASWAFIADVLDRVAGHPGARWINVDAAFAALPGAA